MAAPAPDGDQRRTDSLVAVGDVEVHGGFGGRPVSGFDRIENRLVLARDPPVPGVRLGQQADDVVQLGSDLLDGAAEVAVAGRAGDGEVELGVVVHVVGLARRFGHPSELTSHCREIVLPALAATADTRGSRVRRYSRSSSISSRRRRVRRISSSITTESSAGNEHERAARPAAPGLDEVVGLEDTQGSLDRRAPHPEHRRELALRGQGLARRDQPQRDMAADLLGDVLVCAQLLDPLEANLVVPRAPTERRPASKS